MTKISGTKFKCDSCGCNFITDNWCWMSTEIRIKEVECPKCNEITTMWDENSDMDYIIITTDTVE